MDGTAKTPQTAEHVRLARPARPGTTSDMFVARYERVDHRDVIAEEAQRIVQEADARAEKHARRRGPGRPRKDGLRAWYTVPELAEMANTTPRQLEGSLPPGLAKQAAPGKKRRVYVSDLKRACPDLWESLLDLAAARKRAA